ncbi:MAG: hypothetical protein Kapaf2KO_23350 [Candidatus Kapaibacteriales bacterium]
MTDEPIIIRPIPRKRKYKYIIIGLIPALIIFVNDLDIFKLLVIVSISLVLFSAVYLASSYSYRIKVYNDRLEYLAFGIFKRTLPLQDLKVRETKTNPKMVVLRSNKKALALPADLEESVIEELMQAIALKKAAINI